MAAAKTAKASFDQFANVGAQGFKDNVEKSMAALNDLNAASQKNMEAVVASAAAAAKGAEALGAQAIAFGKKTVEDNIAAAKSMAGVRSVQEAVELQTAFVKSSMETYLAEVARMGEIVTAHAKESLQPLSERATAAMERVQAAR